MLDVFDKSTALVIVDVQNDYFLGGLNTLVNAQEALEKIKGLLGVFREKQQLVIHVRHVSLHKDARFFLPDTKGSEIHEALSPFESEPVIIKHKADSFLGTNLKEVLDQNGIKRLVMCGMMSHHCIDTTVRSGSSNYEIVLVHDACATKDLSFKGETIKAEVVQKTFMAALQGFAKVVSAQEIL